MEKKVRIIDIGSNSIKALVSSQSKQNTVVAECEYIEEVRIGSGLAGKGKYVLSTDARYNAIQAVARLLAKTEPHCPTLTRIVATSAVRDADNRQEFATQIMAACNCPLTILSGNDEAHYIAKGVAGDIRLQTPAVIVDLGGGSLECIDVVNGVSHSTCSLQLGAVRLSEQFHSDFESPLTASAAHAIYQLTQTQLAAQLNGLQHQRTICVGCGGAFAVIRSILAQREQRPYAQRSATISLSEIRQLQREIANATHSLRLAIPGLPASRADIFPTALTILLAVADYLGTHTFYHSVRNLRYGLAEELFATA